jgi:hypothetical protein
MVEPMQALNVLGLVFVFLSLVVVLFIVRELR